MNANAKWKPFGDFLLTFKKGITDLEAIELCAKKASILGDVREAFNFADKIVRYFSPHTDWV